jgi:hypothetical protein
MKSQPLCNLIIYVNAAIEDEIQAVKMGMYLRHLSVLSSSRLPQNMSVEHWLELLHLIPTV